MKKYLTLALAAALLSACAPSNQDYALKAKQNAEQGPSDAGGDNPSTPNTSAQTQENNPRDAVQAEGALAGKITVEGVVVARRGSQFVLNPLIQVEQFNGLGSDGNQVAGSAENAPEYNDKPHSDKNDAAVASKKFMNLGCGDLSAADTEGLEEITPSLKGEDGVLMVSATKIFICGSHKVETNFTTITAEELVINNAELSLTDKTGNLILITNSLNVQGKNILATQGVDQEVTVSPAPALQLTVLQELRGSGSLLLKSTGGNVLKSSASSAAEL